MSRLHRTRIATALLIAALVLGSPPAESNDSTDAVTDVAEYLSRLEKLGFAGAVAVVEGDEPLLVRGYGKADRQRDLPWSPATVSTVGSITKQFTGAAILALAEEGRVAIDDPMSLYLADVPDDKQAITLHHLLTHSSGIIDVEGYGDFDPLRREEFVRLAMEQDLAFEPGTGYEYSNAGYSLLGAIIERVTGVGYEAFLRQRLLLPAGMYETGYIRPQWGEGRLAQGYRRGEPWGTVVGRPMAEDGPYWVLRANGGIHTTVWDMVRWARALLDGEVLSSDSMEAYWAPHLDEGGGDSFYGYGWVVMDAGGAKVITHNGGNGIFFADMAIVPEAELILVVMTNVAADFNLVGDLMSQIGQRLLAGQPLPSVPDIADDPGDELIAFAGTYELAGGGTWRATASDGRLDIEALDARAFTALLSTRQLDHERAARLSGRIEEISAASFAGDFAPLAAAYGGAVTAEYLDRRWAERREMLEERYGELRSYTVLGTALRDGRDVTLVRFELAEGEAYRAYVWDPEAEEELLGVSQRGLDHVLHVRRLTEGGHASWDGRSGATFPVDLTPTAEGARLTLHAGSQVVAERSGR